MQSLKIYFVVGVVLILIISALYLFLLSIRTNKMNKKFANFALSSTNNSVSFFDKIYNLLWGVLKLFSNLLSKSKLLSLYSKRFDRYVAYNDKRVKGIDYLTIKILLAFITFGISFVFVLIDFVTANYFFVVGLSFFIYLLPNLFLELKYVNIRKMVKSELLQAIIIINDELKNSKNIYDSILSVSKRLDGSISDEFKRISTDLSYGLSLGEAFKKFDERIYIDETYFISNILNRKEIALIDIISLFNFIENYLEDKNEESNLIKRSFYLSKLLYYGMTVLPLVILAFVYIYNSSIISYYFNSLVDYCLVLPIILFYFGYVLIINLAFEVDSL